MNIKRLILSLLTYETPKLVTIKNWKIGIMQRALQALIAIYVVCWVFIYEKGYQVNDYALTAVTTKVKGILIANYPSELTEMPHVHDAADLVHPALENNAFFIMTNRIKTLRQTPSSCADVISHSKKLNLKVKGSLGSACISDEDCVSLTASASELGVHTGKCLNQSSGSGVCEIYAWCPLENDTHILENGQQTLEYLRNSTVYIKNDIEFPNFNVKRNNREAWASNASIGSCRYDPAHPIDKYCPIFKMSTIFDQTGVDVNTILRGGVLGIMIRWDCDLDYGIESCNPEYSFTNMEDSHEKSSGFSFRYAIYYRDHGVLHRDLIKAYGIRFYIFVHATAGKFNIIPLVLHLGSGLALLSLAPVVCDIVILDLVKTRQIYQKAKFEVVDRNHGSKEEVSEKCTMLERKHQHATHTHKKTQNDCQLQPPLAEME